MYILGIETSCDETAASVVKGNDKGSKVEVLSSIIASQIDIHKKYGGVIPEVAAREHVLQIIPVIDHALKEAKIKKSDLDFIAVTKGPGLITSLLSGNESARALAYAWDKEIMEVNHIEGHIYSAFINLNEPPSFPCLILTVSGGHSNLIIMQVDGKLDIIGETLDDAAGEAFDKGAKMMNLGYPGGPIISKYAQDLIEKSENIEEIDLPRPMLNSGNFYFSFSGLKTALLYKLKKDKDWQKRVNLYCYSYQEAIIEVLIKKTLKAAEKYGAKSIVLSGGVSANKRLREKMSENISKKINDVKFLLPDLKYTTDNAAMIAAAAYFKYKQGRKLQNYTEIKADPNWEL